MATAKSILNLLKTRFERLRSNSTIWEGVCYRSSTPKYATERDLVTGVGSKFHGGRWNPIGIAALYASLTPETAMAEALAHYRYYGLPVQDAMPRTFVAIFARLRQIIDLRSSVVRQRLRVSLETLLAVDWRKEMQAGRMAITQQLGQAAYETGFEGLIVPAASSEEGHNLLIFPDNLHRGSIIQVQNADSLAP